jgi:protein-S-isoprenylcysteine O-methyltransferase Ste14
MQPLFQDSGMYQTVFVAAVILFGIQQLPALWSTLKLRFRGGAGTADRGSYSAIQALVVIGVSLGYLAATRLSQATIAWHRPLVFFLGIALILLGSIVSWLAVLQLGRYFTVVVAVRSDQPIIQSGIYRYIRHPSYCGQLLVFLGYAVALTNWVSIPAVMLPIVPAYVYRIAVEERALRGQLGRPYADYTGRTDRLIPRIW